MSEASDIGPARAAFSINEDERDLIRSLIIADPALVLGDDQVMRALIGDTGAGGRQVVDLRDRLVERLEARLGRLVQANRSMIAAAYENVAGTQQVHRAIIELMDEPDLGGFLRRLTQDVPRMMDISEARLCIEADVDGTEPAKGLGSGLEGRVLALPEGMVEAYLALDGHGEARDIVLREAEPEAEMIFGRLSQIGSEAIIRMELTGAPAILVFGAADLERFGPDQGTDLLAFFGRVVARMLERQLEEEGAEGSAG